MSCVRRDGGLGELPTAELVVGDVIEVEAGDLVPAAALAFSSLTECLTKQERTTLAAV